MIELIILLIRALSNSGEGSQQEQARRQWAQQQAWEWQQRQRLARREQGGPERQAVPPARPARSAGRVAPPPVPMVPLSVPTEAVPAPRRGEAPAAVGAAALAKWLRPGTLRSQFILTEVLKPPVALRALRG